MVPIEMGVLAAIAAVFVFGFGVSLLVTWNMTGDPGAMDRGFGQFFGAVFTVVGLGTLILAMYWIRRGDPASRKRQYAFIAVAAVASSLMFGFSTARSVTAWNQRVSALEATSWRFDFREDQADAYWAWYADEGGVDSFYLGDYSEWWSLDPDGDGVTDADAPILRVLDDGWSDRGLTIVDQDGDHLIDQLEWSPRDGSDCWLVQVQFQGDARDPEARLYLAAWWEAMPVECQQLP